MAATYTLISSQVLGTSAANVTFSSIPQTYTDLALKVSVRTNYADYYDTVKFQFNSDTGANYSYTDVHGTGTAAASQSGSNITFNLTLYGANGNAATSNSFGSAEMYIPNYTSTNSKAIITTGVNETNSSNAYLSANANLYRNSSAISSILCFPALGTNFFQYSSFYLYGIKNA